MVSHVLVLVLVRTIITVNNNVYKQEEEELCLVVPRDIVVACSKASTSTSQGAMLEVDKYSDP